MKNETQAVAAKQEYQAPLLSELGDLSDLTLASANAGADGNVVSA